MGLRDKAKKLLQKKGYTAKQVEKILDLQFRLADIIFDKWLGKLESEKTHAESKTKNMLHILPGKHEQASPGGREY